MASTCTVEQTRIERKASSNERYQKTSASKSTLSSWNTAASTGGTGLLKLIRESLPGLLRVHVGADALVSAKQRIRDRSVIAAPQRSFRYPLIFTCALDR